MDFESQTKNLVSLTPSPPPLRLRKAKIISGKLLSFVLVLLHGHGNCQNGNKAAKDFEEETFLPQIPRTSSKSFGKEFTIQQIFNNNLKCNPVKELPFHFFGGEGVFPFFFCWQSN